MQTIPADLYPHLVATLFPGPVPICSSSDLSQRYAYTVSREEMRQCRRPACASIARLAATCKAMRRAVKEAHTQDAHNAVLRWWRFVINTPLKVGPTPQHDMPEGMRRIFREKAEMHRLWMPAPLGDANDKHRPFHTSQKVFKACVVWIHRHRDVLKLQCGFAEHEGPSVTLLITEREHPSDDEDDEDDEEEVTDANANEANANDANANTNADAESSDADSADSMDTDDLMQRPGVHGWLDQPLVYTGAGSKANATADDAQVDHGWPAASDPADADANNNNDADANDNDANSSSSGESWQDIDRALVDTFERVPEAALQARVEQWLREQREALFPSNFSCKR
jgi:hypothetical protein